jgi:hypothetical protein
MSTIRRSSFTPSDCQARADSYGRRREVSPIRSLQSRTIFIAASPLAVLQ